MKLLRTGLVAVLVTMPLSAALAGSIPPEARRDIDAANNNWVPALEKGDIDSACSAFTDDALIVSADGKVTNGIAAYEAALKTRMDAGMKITGGKVVSSGAEPVAGQIVEWGSSLLTVSDKNGAHNGGGYYLAVWAKQPDGHWKIIRNIGLGAHS